MPRPYADDLRWRMVFQHKLYQRTYENIASDLFVCRKTVQRTCRTFYNTGDVRACRVGRPTGSTTLFPHEEYIIMDAILKKSNIQLHEIVNKIVNSTGSAFSVETLCRTIHKLGITRKKVTVDNIYRIAMFVMTILI